MGPAGLTWFDVALTDPADLANRIQAGERRALAQAITLAESTRLDHRASANELLDVLAQDATQRARPLAVRVGISGTPGVGKSTLIEALGLCLIAAGHRVAVLAVDPSSVRTGGSIMGDKTRMTELSRNPDAFIRPSASQGVLGGVANRTGEVVGLVEAAGFDVVIVETVGVGQSEVAVASITDLFVLLVAPAGGDDLQGIKRGVMELVDAVLVNKADGDLVALANHTAADYQHALSFLRPKRDLGTPPVLTASAIAGRGVAEAWEAIENLWLELHRRGEIAETRSAQAVAAMNREIEGILATRLLRSTEISEAKATLERHVGKLAVSPSSAASQLTDLLFQVT